MGFHWACGKREKKEKNKCKTFFLWIFQKSKLNSTLNCKLKFEIGTEEDIRKFETSDLIYMLEFFKKNLSESKFKQIEYLVIQSGVSLDLVNKKNIGVFVSPVFAS